MSLPSSGPSTLPGQAAFQCSLCVLARDPDHYAVLILLNVLTSQYLLNQDSYYALWQPYISTRGTPLTALGHITPLGARTDNSSTYCMPQTILYPVWPKETKRLGPPVQSNTGDFKVSSDSPLPGRSSEAAGPAQPVSLQVSDLGALAPHQIRDQGDSGGGWVPLRPSRGSGSCCFLGPADQWQDCLFP